MQVFAIEALQLTVDCDRNAHFAHWADGNAPTQLVSLRCQKEKTGTVGIPRLPGPG